MTSGAQITPLRRADIPELSQFLISIRGDRVTSSHQSQEVLSWKYFDGPSGPSGDSVCSLIARSAGRIIGHIGMCPRQLIVSGGGATPVSTMHAIDWHSSAAHPGSGALLMLRAFATSKTQYAVGGSEHSQALFPRLGFEQKPKLGKTACACALLPMAYCVLLVAKARSIKKVPEPGCAAEQCQSMACIADTGVAPSPDTKNWRGHIPMCPTILPAERAIRLQTESPAGPLGPSKYFHERTS